MIEVNVIEIKVQAYQLTLTEGEVEDLANILQNKLREECLDKTEEKTANNLWLKLSEILN